MRRIAAIPWNGLTVVSTFSGCGGSCLGFRMAGYRVLWASEFVPAAQDVYRANHPTTHLDTRDIRKVTAASIRKVIGRVDVDVLEGSPPCAAFSMAGKRERKWGEVRSYSDTSQRVDDLFGEFRRIADELNPRTFVMENVSGLIKGVAKGVFKETLRDLTLGGRYRVKCALLDAQWLGVPQQRQRVMFIGVRQDVERAPAYPQPFGFYYSIADALPWIQASESRNGPGFAIRNTEATRPAPTVTADDAQMRTGVTREIRKTPRYDHKAARRARSDQPLPTVLQHGRSRSQIQIEVSDHRSRTARSHRPMPTLLAERRGWSDIGIDADGVKRRFTIAELKRLCSYPDDFTLTGSYGQQWERLGRSVPPLMMRAVAETLRDEVLAARRAGRNPPRRLARRPKSGNLARRRTG